jgi:hypothetical protein
MPAITQPRLSPAQVESFLQEGYLVFNDQVFPADKLAGLKACFEKILADRPADKRPEAMDVPHFSYPELFEWLFADEVLDLVEPILGPDIALFSSHFICKPHGNGKRVPWHEDSAYWKGMMDKSEVCTVWLAIDPSRRENGCMQVIPHSHRTGKKGFSDYEPVDAAKNVFSKEIVKPQVDDRIAVALELEPGQASLHDGRIIHGSDANTSPLRRCGYTMRYISTRTRFNHERNQLHQIYLARGRDHAGNQYADPARSYADIAGERVRHGKTGH